MSHSNDKVYISVAMPPFENTHSTRRIFFRIYLLWPFSLLFARIKSIMHFPDQAVCFSFRFFSACCHSECAGKQNDWILAKVAFGLIPLTCMKRREKIDSDGRTKNNQVFHRACWITLRKSKSWRNEEKHKII